MRGKRHEKRAGEAEEKRVIWGCNASGIKAVNRSTERAVALA